MEREALDIDTETLQKRIVVCYTGEPRNSGTNNWEITKRHIDGDNELFDIFEGIRDDSINLREALLESDWEKVGEILKNAHPHRKRLSPNITTPQMDLLIEKALANGAIAAENLRRGRRRLYRIFLRRRQTRDVEKALAEEEGAEVLDWSLATEGLTIKEM